MKKLIRKYLIAWQIMNQESCDWDNAFIEYIIRKIK